LEIEGDEYSTEAPATFNTLFVEEEIYSRFDPDVNAVKKSKLCHYAFYISSHQIESTRIPPIQHFIWAEVRINYLKGVI
jgi:hypothetical protein